MLVFFRSLFTKPCGAGLAILAATILALSLSACAGRVADRGKTGQATAPAPAPVPTPEIALTPPPIPGSGGPRIGLLLPLSGPRAELGRAMLQAAELALFETGADDIALIVRDTEKVPGGAGEAARQVVQEGARIIIGPLFAQQVKPVLSVAAPAGINVVSFSTDRAVAGGGAYVMGVLPGLQVDRVIAYAAARGLRRLGALVPSTPYGSIVAAALNDSAARHGGRVVRVDYYDPAQADLSPVVRQFATAIGASAATAIGGTTAAEAEFVPGQNGLTIDALLLPEGVERLRIVAPLLPFYDVDPRRLRMLGTALWDEPALAAEPALLGGWYAATDPAGWRSLSERYRAAWGTPPPRIASLAYDGVALAIALAKRADQPDPFDAASLTQPSGFGGVDGIFRFRPDGTVERGLAVMELRREGAQVVDPAPVSFEPLIN